MRETIDVCEAHLVYPEEALYNGPAGSTELLAKIGRKMEEVFTCERGPEGCRGEVRRLLRLT